MAVSAPSFAACGVRIAEDGAKGKVVLSERAFDAGDVIFSEQAFVYAPWSSDVCDGCEEDKDEAHPTCHCDRTGEPKRMYSEALTKDAVRREAIVLVMAEMESIAEVDRARCILKCLAMYERDGPEALAEVLALTTANVESCLEEAALLRETIPDIFPTGFTDDQMATLMGVLNTNSHELENLGGSGLFLSACRMEHNCLPNCSFTTYDAELWMTAIRPIAKGEPLSIDYGNFFYRPTEERMASLLESYGFICSCEACTVLPDTCRAFKCASASCTDGVVYPYSQPQASQAPLTDPEALTFDWKCSQCGYTPSENECASFIAAEEKLLEEGFPDDLAAVDALVARSPLHERHYLLFWALDAMGCEGAAINAVIADEESRAELAQVWQRIITIMNVTVPGPHHEKTIYYDNLAQVEVVLGNRNAAVEAYTRAYEIACIVSGKDCVPTQKLRALADNPPADAEELRKTYAHIKHRDEEEEDDDEDEEWEDEEEEEEAVTAN